MARMKFDTKTAFSIQRPIWQVFVGKIGRYLGQRVWTNIDFIRNQLRNGQDNTEERYNGRRIIAGKYRGKKEQVGVWTNACSRATMHRKRGKYMEKEKHFSAARSLERGSLSRLPCCHSSRMRMSAAAMIRPLHLFYRMRTSYHSRHPPRFPLLPFSLITPFWFVSRDKAGTCPRPLCCNLSRGRSAAREREPLFNGATGSSHELFIAAR